MRIALLAAAAALVSFSSAHAADPFNPQPDPPGRHAVDSFNPQPDPPGRHDMARDKICHGADGKVVKCATPPPPCHDAQGRTLACEHKPG
jgi:hypothetical protein